MKVLGHTEKCCPRCGKTTFYLIKEGDEERYVCRHVWLAKLALAKQKEKKLHIVERREIAA